MRNPEWVQLSDAQRGQILGIWLLAADREGTIPASPALVQKLCFLDSEPDLHLFSRLGFLDSDQQFETSDSHVSATCPQNDALEKKRKEKNREAKASLGHRKALTEGLFDQFWVKYPRKVKKPTALKAFCRVMKDRSEEGQRDLLDTMLIAVEKQKRRWGDPQYIPHPATWLNAAQWEDDDPGVEQKKNRMEELAEIEEAARNDYERIHGKRRKRVEALSAREKPAHDAVSTAVRGAPVRCPPGEAADDLPISAQSGGFVRNSYRSGISGSEAERDAGPHLGADIVPLVRRGG